MSQPRPARRLVLEPLEDRTTPATLPAEFSEAAVAQGLSEATAMEFAPNGDLWVLEQTGMVKRFRPGETAADVVADVGLLGLRTEGERGLLGIAFDPDFAGNKLVYFYYTSSADPDPHNRVSRFVVDDTNPDDYTLVDTTDDLRPYDEQVVLDLDPLSATNHNGGAIHFGPDGKLYVATGDNAETANSQSLDTRLGKILRVNPDGTIPTDNPTSFAGVPGTPTGLNEAIWAVGLRNPYTFTFDPASGAMYINDVGQNTSEEVDAGAPGANYGWPQTEGDFDPAAFPDFTRPVYSYQHGTDTFEGFAITGGAFYSPSTVQFPAEYAGDYFFADFVMGWINVVNADGTDPRRFATGTGGTLDLRVADDGSLYYLDRGAGAVFRVTSDELAFPSVVAQPDDASAFEGATVSFSVTASGTEPLAYQWQHLVGDAWLDLANGDGVAGATTDTLRLTGVTAENAGDYRVVVSNAAGSVESDPATLTVVADEPPTAPADLTASDATTTSVDLTWTASTDDNGSVTYRVLARQVGGEFAEVGQTSETAFTVEGLAPATAYEFAVVATDTAGNESEASNTAAATTLSEPDTEPPSAPTAAEVADVTTTGLTLSWTAADDNVAVTGYQILASEAGDEFEPVGESATTSFAVTGLTPDTDYAFVVVARDEAGNASPQSEPATTSTLPLPDTTPPSVPAGVEATEVTETSVTLAWTASTDDVGVTGYTILFRPDGGTFTEVGSSAASPFTVTDLNPGTVYDFRVVATDAAGNTSAPSLIVSATTTAQRGPFIVASTATGEVRMVDPATGTVLRAFTPFAGYDRLVNVALGDVNGDGFVDIICAANGAARGRVKIYDGMLAVGLPPEVDFGDTQANPQVLLRVADPFEPGFDPAEGLYDAGLTVAAGDVNGDGKADVICGTRPGAGVGRVVVLDGASLLVPDAPPVAVGEELHPFGDGFTGGVQVAAGDLGADGNDEVIVGTASNRARVKAFALGADDAFTQVFGPLTVFADDPNGVRLTALDADGDGNAEIAVGRLTAAGAVELALFDANGDAVGGFAENYAREGATGLALAAFTPASGPAELLVGVVSDAAGTTQVDTLAGATGERTGGFDPFDSLTGNIALGGV